MYRGNGIYSKFSSNSFLFLSIDVSIKGELKSSLQSFETSLLMISLGRWTYSIIHIFNAIEIVIKDKVENKSEMKEKADEFFFRYQISNELKNSFENVRKLRNKFIHQSTIPEDNIEAIISYLYDGISVYKIFIEKCYRKNIYELLYPKEISKNLVFAKNLFKKNYKDLIKCLENKYLIEISKVPYFVSVLVKSISNNYYDLIIPNSVYQLTLDHNDIAIFEKENEEKSRFEEIYNYIGQDVDHELDIPCPASCEGNLSIAFNNNEPDFINKLVSRSQCMLCGLEIFTDEMINEYVMKFINEDKILKSFGLKK